MSQVTWTKQALEDLQAIHEYISRDSPRYADLAVQRLIASVDRLLEFPRSGRIVPEFQDEAMREIIHGSYRLVYRLSDDHLDVLTVYHGFRILRISSIQEIE